MAAEHDQDLARVAQQIRIQELMDKLRQLGGEHFSCEAPADLPLELQERFLRSVLEFETAPLTTHFQHLVDHGVALPEPGTLDDEELSRKLWEVIRALADIDVYLMCTNHLIDRQI